MTIIEKKKRFIIVNNGMTEARGHYVETALSVAEEALRRGFTVYLAVHEACTLPPLPAGIVPMPIFRVDHWGVVVHTADANAEGIAVDLAAERAVTIEDVRAGRSTVARYLSAKFGIDDEAPPAPASRRSLASLLTPPIIPLAVGFLYRQRRPIKRAFWTTVRMITPPILTETVDRLRVRVRHAKQRRRAKRAARAIEVAQTPAEAKTARHAALAAALTRVGGPREAELQALFRADLERVLILTGAGAGDIMFHPTAHGREALAVADLIEDVGAANLPSFHLEFRHAVRADAGAEPTAQLDPYSSVHKLFFDACARGPVDERMHLYTDTQELARDYEALTGRTFAVLPIPFRAKLMPEVERRDGPLVALFLGDPREEKGFCLLPDLIETLHRDLVATGRLRFVIQAGVHRDALNPRMVETLGRLEAFGEPAVTLVGRDGFVPEAEYYRHLSGADIVLLPYDAVTYRARSSGVLAEAVAGGKPVIVPADTWLGSQMAEGAGERFVTEADLADALRRITLGYEGYRARALGLREAWLRHHSPEGLIAALIAADATIPARRGT